MQRKGDESTTGKIREHEIELANKGGKVYYKKVGEEKWKGPRVVIGKDGKTVVIKHDSSLRNVTKIQITGIQGLPRDRSDRNEEDEEDIEGSGCFKARNEEKVKQKNGLQKGSKGDESDSEGDGEVNYL